MAGYHMVFRAVQNTLDVLGNMMKGAVRTTMTTLGVVMVVLTAPFIMLPSTSKVFWTALKTMWYPAIYPAALIIIMQLTAAMSSWIGTIGANISGMAIMFDAIPLCLGIVSIFMLPKIVKVMLTGGNVFLAQMSGVKTVAMLALAAATG